MNGYDIYLVDVPGFDDSDLNYSTENDISTSLGICDLFKACGSIRPVVLIDCNAIKADRGKGFKEILNIIKKILPNFEEEKSKLNIFYTHHDK